MRFCFHGRWHLEPLMNLDINQRNEADTAHTDTKRQKRTSLCSFRKLSRGLSWHMWPAPGTLCDLIEWEERSGIHSTTNISLDYYSPGTGLGAESPVVNKNRLAPFLMAYVWHLGRRRVSHQISRWASSDVVNPRTEKKQGSGTVSTGKAGWSVRASPRRACFSECWFASWGGLARIF